MPSAFAAAAGNKALCSTLCSAIRKRRAGLAFSAEMLAGFKLHA
jgi:hypothetical protein